MAADTVDVLLEVWGCAKCKRHVLPTVKNLGAAGEAKVCSHCGSEDIFPLDDGGWSKDALDTMKRNTDG